MPVLGEFHGRVFVSEVPVVLVCASYLLLYSPSHFLVTFEGTTSKLVSYIKFVCVCMFICMSVQALTQEISRSKTSSATFMVEVKSTL